MKQTLPLLIRYAKSKHDNLELKERSLHEVGGGGGVECPLHLRTSDFIHVSFVSSEKKKLYQ